ncbi:MAG: bifunctional metallophosphatase/5'-nucleotidase [Rhizobiales bacterium]|nr:bifunctional metallophosphatase/5'-nucleotidase [Hyphomicrobiales bacterium]
MSLFRRLAAALLILAALAGAGTAQAETSTAQTTKITFILVNDIYLMSDTRMADGQRRGGFARLAAIVKAERERARVSGGHVLFAHAGDTLSPSLMSGFDRGEHIITLTNMIRPDVFAPGNHEFDFGKQVFFERMAAAKFPLYAANLRMPDGKPLSGFRDRLIITLDGVRVGLTGTTFDGTPLTSSPEDLQFLPTVSTTVEQAKLLRKEGADFVVAVTHAERKQDYEMFATRTIDLILTGHDHDLFINYDQRNGMVESSYDAHYVTAVDVSISVKEQDGKRVTTWWPQFRPIDTATVTPDPEVAAAVAKFEAEFTREMDVPLGTTAVELDSRTPTVRSREAAIGDLIADAMRVSTKADIAIMNGGGIRGGRLYAPGTNITRRDVLAELPFDNRVVVVDATGAAIKAAIENGLSQWPDLAGRFPQVSGMTIEANLSRPPGSRVISIRVAGEPLDDKKIYKVAINDFMSRGGDGYTMFEHSSRLLPDPDGPLLANDVMVYIRKLGTVKTGVDGRIVLK